MWVTVNLGETPKEVYKYTAHGPWRELKGTGRRYCNKCGLISLKNPFTNWCIERGCMNDIHPSYKQKRKLTGIQGSK